MCDKKIKVLVISHMYPDINHVYDGIFVHECVMGLKEKENCEIIVISPRPYCPIFLSRLKKTWRYYSCCPKYAKIDGIEVYYPRYLVPPFMPKLFYFFCSLSLYYCVSVFIGKIIRKFKPDILHAHAATPDGYTAVKLKKSIRPPVVCTLLGSDIHSYPQYDFLSFNFTKKVIQETDQLIAVSCALKAEAESISAPKNKISVIYYGYNLEKFSFNLESRLMMRKKIGADPNSKVLIFVGSLEKNKGLFELLNSYIFLSKQYPNLYLIIIGDGSQYASVKILSLKKHLENKIYLAGPKPHNEIPYWLSAGDIFVLPSYMEGFGVSIIEAMACRRPVIATKAGGIPEIVVDGQTGILIDVKDINSLNNAIIRLIEDEKLCLKMGCCGRERVEAMFSMRQNIHKIRQTYERLVAGAISAND